MNKNEEGVQVKKKAAQTLFYSTNAYLFEGKKENKIQAITCF